MAASLTLPRTPAGRRPLAPARREAVLSHDAVAQDGSRQARAANKIAASSTPGEKWLRWVAPAFLVSIMLPWPFSLGPISLTPYRLVLLALFIPCAFRWIRGMAGPIRAFDMVLVAHALWVFVCLMAALGPNAAIAPGASYLAESVGAFLVARCFIRNQEDFLRLARFLFVLLLVLAPLEIIESLTGHNVALQAASLVAPTLPVVDDAARMGLRRVQSVFEHPILAGAFATGLFAFVHVVAGQAVLPARRWMQTSTVVICAFLPLSSAPLAALLLQVFLLCWNRALRTMESRWRLLTLIGIALYAFVEFFSNQSIIGVYISRFTFESHSAFYRMAIWDYGWASVLNHPLFGVAYGEWDRASWMTSSIDNFWLLNAVRWGMPGAGLLIIAAALICLQIAAAHQPDPVRASCKIAFLVSMTAWFIMGFTVHYWAASFVLFTFLLGSGAWLLETKDAPRPKQRVVEGRNPRAARNAVLMPRRQDADASRLEKLKRRSGLTKGDESISSHFGIRKGRANA